MSKTQVTKTNIPPEEFVILILDTYDSIFEKRLQAVAFLSEVWIDDNNKVSSASYERVSRNIYSENIRNSLQALPDVYSRVAYQNGFRTTKWFVKNVTTDKCTLSTKKQNEVLDIIQDVKNHTNNLSNDELMRAVRQLDCVQNTTKYKQIQL